MARDLQTDEAKGSGMAEMIVGSRRLDTRWFHCVWGDQRKLAECDGHDLGVACAWQDCPQASNWVIMRAGSEPADDVGDTAWYTQCREGKHRYCPEGHIDGHDDCGCPCHVGYKLGWDQGYEVGQYEKATDSASVDVPAYQVLNEAALHIGSLIGAVKSHVPWPGPEPKETDCGDCDAIIARARAWVAERNAPYTVDDEHEACHTEGADS